MTRTTAKQRIDDDEIGREPGHRVRMPSTSGKEARIREGKSHLALAHLVRMGGSPGKGQLHARVRRVVGRTAGKAVPPVRLVRPDNRRNNIRVPQESAAGQIPRELRHHQ